LFILLRNFQVSSELTSTDAIYTGIFALYLVIAVYVNLLVLIPKFFDRQKHWIFIISLAILLGAMTYIQIFSFDVIVEKLFPGYYLITYFDYWETLNYFIIFIGITTLLHFSKSWFLYRESEAKLTKVLKEKAEAELEALKNQINPHFLFNSLNSIYSMVLHKSNAAPDALIKLSDSMRYIIYEANQDKIALKKELEFITDYIELQKLRMSAKDKLNFKINGKIRSQVIAPLLLIPIVENCFKYGIKGETEASFLDINIVVSSDYLIMQTNNNLGFVDSAEKNKSKGTGLANLRKRLELIYPNKHELKTDNTSGSFSVYLKIAL
jgi:two-component sensor histidine kinase